MMKRIALIAIGIFFLTQLSGYAGDISGKVKCRGVRDSKDVVVYITDIGKDPSPPKEHKVMNQKNLEFIPHVLPIVKGTTVDYLNSDDVMHNVFTPDGCADKMNLGTWPKDSIRSYTFEEEACVSVMLCNVHPEMEAFVIIMQNPYFSTTDKEGNFTIENVPAGEYTVSVWHPKRKAESTVVVVPDSGSVSMEIALKKK